MHSKFSGLGDLLLEPDVEEATDGARELTVSEKAKDSG